MIFLDRHGQSYVGIVGTAAISEKSTFAAMGAEAGAVSLLGLQVTLAKLITYPALLLVSIGGGAFAIR